MRLDEQPIEAQKRRAAVRAWLRGLIAVLLPRRLWPVSVWLAWPLVAYHVRAARLHGGGPRHLGIGRSASV